MAPEKSSVGTAIRPGLKKSLLDPMVPRNYRPISNLSFVSKVLERVAADQLCNYMEEHSLNHPYQSAYRRHHSVETALTKVYNDIMLALDREEGAILVVLDLSAAFDTVDHTILLSRLESRFGLSGPVLNWLESYLSGREQRVMVGSTLSKPTILKFGVSQGSVLGPVLFSAYISPLADIASCCNIGTHQYADDCQLYLTFNPKDPLSVQQTIGTMEYSVETIRRWMVQNCLKQNDDKTELMVLTPPRIQNGASLNGIWLGDSVVSPSFSVKNLGSIWDQCMTMESHINNVCKSCYFHLHNISAIRQSLTRSAAEKIIHAFVTSKLDFNNALLYHLPKKCIAKLQRVQNVAARVVVKASKYSSVSSILQSLHWLPVATRIEFKLCIMTWKALRGLGPTYISELLVPYGMSRSLCSCENNLLDIPRCRVNYGERAFSIAAPKMWNSLPAKLRHAGLTYESFKSNLKTYLFKKSYGV